MCSPVLQIRKVSLSCESYITEVWVFSTKCTKMSSGNLSFSGKIFHSRNQQVVAFIVAVLFTLNQVYDVIFILAEIALYIYKGVMLPYEPKDIGLESALLALLLILELLRFSFGKKGYLTQKPSSLALALLLTPAVLLIGIHIMIWQNFWQYYWLFLFARGIKSVHGHLLISYFGLSKKES